MMHVHVQMEPKTEKNHFMSKYIEKCYNIVVNIIPMFYKQYLFQTQEIHP